MRGFLSIHFASYSFTMKLPAPKLSIRMKAFIEHALPNESFWDVCCDHGYVGIKALTSNRFTSVHFVDQIPHIMKRLQQLIYQDKDLRAEHIYFLQTCAGEDIEGVVEGTLLIAGVGGLTMKNILNSLLNKKTLLAQRLLLSPHTDEKVIVEYIISEAFLIHYEIQEKIMLPEGKRLRPLYILNKVAQK